MNEAVNLVNGCMKLYNVIPAYLATKQYLPGVPITNNTKEFMVESFKGFLETRLITFSNQLITTTNKREFHANTDEDGICTPYYILKMARDQLGRFRKVVTNDRNSEIYDIRYTFHGKDFGMNDDLAVAIIMVIYWSLQYKSRITGLKRPR